MGRVPLERALSKLGVASRNQTRQWIKAGKIAVNGKTVYDPAFLVVPEAERITIDGKPVQRQEARTIMIYKPRGVITTKSDERGRKTVYDLLPAELRHLHPVGRLDMASCGLLLMTTDTQLSNFLTDPKNKIPRIYAVTVIGKITEDQIKSMTKGIQDEGETLKASEVTLRKTSNRESHLLIELMEGKNREIRRIFEALGSEVTALKRISFGNCKLGTLKPGEFRNVIKDEIS